MANARKALRCKGFKGMPCFMDDYVWTYRRPNIMSAHYPESLAGPGFRPALGGLERIDFMAEIN
ncbi:MULTISPECIES: hypothetical protein [unclassified Rhodanobacter]|uniref:hypothetical protein n=1 Tax=unclassified Rhodanobacter TaxID=2621553 RepID=UPI000A49AB4D|nr:hypothetical protein [Rhodanobacter sp. FW104-R8]